MPPLATRGIPSTTFIKDSETRRVADAIVERLRSLEFSVQVVSAATGAAQDSKVSSAASTDIVAGTGILVQRLPNNTFRISASSTGGGSGGSTTINNSYTTNRMLSSLARFDFSTLEANDFMYWDGEKWVRLSVFPVDPLTAVVTINNANEFDDDTSGAETARTTSWTAGTENGLAEWYVSRIVYKHDGDEKLYAFLRKRTYDKYGRLYSVSGETRVVIDVPEDES